jgi:hypothetical protein
MAANGDGRGPLKHDRQGHGTGLAKPFDIDGGWFSDEIKRPAGPRS